MAKLTYVYCKVVASKYNTRTEFHLNGHASVWMKIKKNKWDELISHIPLLIKWTYDRCKEEVSKMTHLSELQDHSACNAMKRNGWFDELTVHLKRQLHRPYTIDEVQVAAAKYNRRVDFQRQSNGEYCAAKRLGVFDEVCKHMNRSAHLPAYTRDECIESARKYKNQRDWKLGDSGTYYTASRSRKKLEPFFDECIEHMDYIFKPNGYWTKERCRVIANKYTTFVDFRNSEDASVYNIIKNNDWWDELCSHMSSAKIPNGYYRLNHDRCLTEASKYKTRSELMNVCSGVYRAILDNKWQSSCFKHMVRTMTMKHRHIYACEFESSKTVYVGLSCEVERRKRSHMGLERNKHGVSKSTVYNYMIKNNETFTFKILTRRPVLEKNAGDREQFYMDKYKSNGWVLLNKAPAGSLGGMRTKWTRDVLFKIKNECTTREEYYKKVPPHARTVAIESGWWPDIMDGLVKTTRFPGEWNEMDCIVEAKKYKNRSELQCNCSGAYKFAKRTGLLKTLFPTQNKNIKSEKFFQFN